MLKNSNFSNLGFKLCFKYEETDIPLLKPSIDNTLFYSDYITCLEKKSKKDYYTYFYSSENDQELNDILRDLCIVRYFLDTMEGESEDLGLSYRLDIYQEEVLRKFFSKLGEILRNINIDSNRLVSNLNDHIFSNYYTKELKLNLTTTLERKLVTQDADFSLKFLNNNLDNVIYMALYSDISIYEKEHVNRYITGSPYLAIAEYLEAKGFISGLKWKQGLKYPEVQVGTGRIILKDLKLQIVTKEDKLMFISSVIKTYALICHILNEQFSKYNDTKVYIEDTTIVNNSTGDKSSFEINNDGDKKFIGSLGLSLEPKILSSK